jgi:adenylate cyclase
MAESPSTSHSSSSLVARRLRLATGLVLFAFIATHLLNHAAGLVSLRAAEQGRLVFVAFWRSAPMTVVFYGALLTHVALALGTLYQRRTLRMPALEAARLALGLVIPLMLAAHFAGTRGAWELNGLDDNYARVAAALWAYDGGLTQLLLTSAAWLHGCMGIHFVLRHRPAYRRRFHAAFAAMLLVPLLALLGFVSMAREIPVRLAAGELLPPDKLTAEAFERLVRLGDGLVALFTALVAATLLLRWARAAYERRRAGRVVLDYPQRQIVVPRGWSVLEASRAHGIPHLSLCGGRARCSTCRIRVTGEPAHVPPPSEAESITLRRIGAPPDVRLACQLRPAGDVNVAPLLRARAGDDPQAGAERQVVVLFVDLRRWTTLSEQHLPHDLAYVLDQFFEVVGEAVRASGGVPNQFVGDSVMALFGLENDLDSACAQAIRAAVAIEAGMAGYNVRLQQEFGHTIDFGMGLHAGAAAVGEVGWRDTRTFSAVGDAVNTAARLQELSKAYGARLVVSDTVAQRAGLDTEGLARDEVAVRGRNDPLVLYPIAAALDGAARLPAREA